MNQYTPGPDPDDDGARGPVPYEMAHGRPYHSEHAEHAGAVGPGDRQAPVRPHNPMVVTWTLIWVNVAVYALMWILNLTGIDATYWLGLAPAVAFTEPWRILTSGFAHSMSNPTHLLLNMYTLWIFGRMLEGGLGRGRFLTVYVASLLGGAAAVVLLSPTYSLTVGASGAVFGLFGAVLAVTLWGPRQFRSNLTTILVLIGVNVVFGFLVPGISWQGHLGGLVTGVVVTGIFLARSRRNPRSSGGRPQATQQGR